MTPKSNGMPDEPLWFKDAIFYELRVRSFFDSNADGIGDFAGLTQKLDYLQDLGVTTLWLLPFYPSPMRDDGYDTADYCDVQPDCGTLEDFQTFLAEAHARGLRVVTELVLNHTSDQHPWFQRARHAKDGSPERNFYVWSDNAERYKEARIIFQDFEHSNWTWDPVANAYFWHRFFSHQPDLNFENPAVHQALFEVVDFWFNLGVDGLRLDAVPYLYEAENTSCENLPQTHAFLRKLRKHVDEKFADRMLLAEANQWPEDAVAYLADGVECHMAFHFPLMPRLFMAVRMEDRFPITDVWAQTPPIPESCQWALFLRNHDELTLEMVTDEERDFMYRAYAQEQRMRVNLGIRRRLAPLLGNDRATIELKNALLLSLPGTPVLYYGDEIGMGDNVYLGDRDGVRTPMQWSGDRNAGFSKANPQRLILPVVIDVEYHYQTVNVETQEQSRHSLLWWMRRIVSLRKQHRAFGRGTIDFLSPDATNVLAFVRALDGEHILVVANLSRFPQAALLDLSRFAGLTPTELFGRTAFPAITQAPYVVTLGAHGFFWFLLDAPKVAGTLSAEHETTIPQLGSVASLPELVLGDDRERFAAILPPFVLRARWFGGKSRSLKDVSVVDGYSLPSGAYLALIDVEYQDGETERYTLPLAFLSGDAAHQTRSQSPERAIAELTLGKDAPTPGVLFDAVADSGFALDLLQLIAEGRSARGHLGLLRGQATSLFPALRGPPEDRLEPKLLRAEQSNSSIAYGDRLIVKVFRKVDAGRSPELEIGQMLAEHAPQLHVPSTAGSIELGARGTEPRTVAVLQQFVANQGDAWQYTHHELIRFYERVATSKESVTAPTGPIFDLLPSSPPDRERDLIGAYLEAALLMGHRTAELHRALASSDAPAFRPEPYTSMYQRSHYQSLRNLAGQSLRALRSRLSVLRPGVRQAADELLAAHAKIDQVFEQFTRRRFSALRIRRHGDLHLGQMLYTGTDFVIVDFEGEPARSLDERRRKGGALRDVAGMLRSFSYAVMFAVLEAQKAGTLSDKDFPAMVAAGSMWEAWVSRAYLKAYLDAAAGSPFLPVDQGEIKAMLEVFLLEKALYELRYELNNRVDWVAIPLHGVCQLLGLADRVSLMLTASPS
jgi:maltose alpha-D-glucosyltransferase/alpha-amylase